MTLNLKVFLLLGVFCMASSPTVHAIAISNVSLSDTNITYETGGIPNGTTVSFILDTPGQVDMGINCGILNAGDTGASVGTVSQIFPLAGTNQIFWNGLWLINGQQGRTVTSCKFSLTLSTNSATSAAATSPLFTLNSVDIHNLFVNPSINSNGTNTAPYTISYSIAKAATVSMTISDSNQTVVRTILDKVLQAPEPAVSTHTFTWDGLSALGQPVPIGIYTVTVTATDQANAASLAIPRTATIAVQSIVSILTDPQKLFESNAYVFPNPVRKGNGTFQFEAVRDGANVSLRVYTLTGDLVFEKKYSGLVGGTIVQLAWNATNQSGNKVGRGLYYYVLREDDNVGTLQTVKKLAVLP